MNLENKIWKRPGQTTIHLLQPCCATCWGLLQRRQPWAIQAVGSPLVLIKPWPLLVAETVAIAGCPADVDRRAHVSRTYLTGHLGQRWSNDEVNTASEMPSFRHAFKPSKPRPESWAILETGHQNLDVCYSILKLHKKYRSWIFTHWCVMLWG